MILFRFSFPRDDLTVELDGGAICRLVSNMLLWFKKNRDRLLASVLMGCLSMFFGGCITARLLDSSRPLPIDRTYKVDAVKSAEQLPNGDIVLFANGRLAAEEPEKTYSFTLLLSAKEIQRAEENYTRIPAIQCEMQGAEGGVPFLVLHNLHTSEARQIIGTNTAAILVYDEGRHFGFPDYDDRVGISYIGQRRDGRGPSVSIEPDSKYIYKSRKKKLWLLPLAVVGDVVTSPFQAVYMVIWFASGSQ